MKNYSLPEEFIPNENVSIGEVNELGKTGDSDDPYNAENVETFSSMLDYAKNELNESSFEIAAVIESFRGPTLVYEGRESIIAVSDYEGGLGIDFYSFNGEPDRGSVLDHLFGEPSGKIQGVKNNMHKTLHGDEAFNEIHELLDSAN